MMEQRILEILKSVFQVDDIDETCSQKNCEKWDSMNHLNLVVELEMEFGISLEPEEIARMQCYDDVVRVIKLKMA